MSHDRPPRTPTSGLYCTKCGTAQERVRIGKMCGGRRIDGRLCGSTEFIEGFTNVEWDVLMTKDAIRELRKIGISPK